MPTLTMIIGPPCAGKTTYALQCDGVVLHMDEIRKSITGTYQLPKAHRRFVYDVCMQAVKHHLSQNRDVVLDGALLSQQARAPYIRIATECDAEVHCVLLDPSKDVLQTRLLARNKEAPVDRQMSMNYVQSIMKKHFELPLAEEGFHHIDYIAEIN